MKSLRALLLILILLCLMANLAACGDEPGGAAGPEPGSPGQGTAAPTDPADESQATLPAGNDGEAPPAADQPAAGGWPAADTEPLTFEWGGAVAGLAWPQPLPAYHPELKVQPLISETTLYTYAVSGPVNFLDEAGQRIPVPEETQFYYVLDSCILLRKAQGLHALMTKDGQVLTDFLYDVDYDEAEGLWPVPTEWGGYIVLAKRTDPLDWSQLLYGLVDVRTGAEVLPFVFERLEIYERFCLAVKDGAAMLTDIQGNSFYTFDSANIYCAPGWYSTPGAEETLVTTDIPGIYPARTPAPVYAFLYDGFTVYLHLDADQSRNKITVLDGEGNHLATRTGFSNYFTPGQNLYIEKDGAFTVVTPAEILDFPYSQAVRQAVEDYSANAMYADVKYGEGLLTVQMRDRDRPYLYVTYTQDGVLTEKRETAWEIVSPRLQYAYSRSGFYYALTDEAGQVIKEYPKNADVRELGPFIRVAEGDAPDTVYSLDNLRGDRLMANIFVPPGHIVWDSLIVYTDENHCWRLYPDGAMLPVADAPPVRHLYIGG